MNKEKIVEILQDKTVDNKIVIDKSAPEESKKISARELISLSKRSHKEQEEPPSKNTLKLLENSAHSKQSKSSGRQSFTKSQAIISEETIKRAKKITLKVLID